VSRHRVHGAPDHGFSHPVLGGSPKRYAWSSRSYMEWDGCDPFCHHIARIASDLLDAEVDDPLA
jgi:hypothetical protein